MVARRRSCGAASTTTSASAAHAGGTPTAVVTTKPRTVAASTVNANRGAGVTGTLGAASIRRSARRKLRRASHSRAQAANHGRTIKPVNRTKVSPDAEKASRLVRLDTGNSKEPALASWVQA